MIKPLARFVPDNGIELVLDARPIEIGKFQLSARSAKPIGRPTLDGWRSALEFACATHEGSPYWIGDLLAYADTRAEWREKLDQVVSLTGLAEKTLHNLGYISRHVEAHERLLAPSLGHSAEVASLERPEQTEWLDKARTEGWTVREMRMEMRAARRRKVIDGQATLAGMYRVIYADPPWSYDDRGQVTASTAYKRAESEYPCMTIEDICKLPVAAHAHPDSVLFLWVTSPLLLCNPGPREVIEAWGFKYKTSIVWDKVLGNFGHYVHACHELLLICTRGSCLPDEPTPQPDSVQTIRRSNVHSQKPDEFRKLITKLYTRGPYLELFGREAVEGWSVFGNDARLWAQQAEQEAVSV